MATVTFAVYNVKGTVRESTTTLLGTVEAANARAALESFSGRIFMFGHYRPEQGCSEHFYQISDPITWVSDGVDGCTAVSVLPPAWPAALLPDTEDIVAFAAKNPCPHYCYGPQQLAEARAALAQKHTGDWTVPEILKQFKKERSDKMRVFWARVLAASRDARAVRAVAELLGTYKGGERHRYLAFNLARDLANYYFGPWRKMEPVPENEPYHALPAEIAWALLWYDHNRAAIEAVAEK